MKLFLKPVVHVLKSSSKQVALKLYSNQILWKGPFPLPRLRIMIVVHIFHLTGPNKLYQFIFVIFITASRTLLACVQQPFVVLACELHVRVLYVCLEYQAFVHFIVQTLFSSLLLVDFFMPFLPRKPKLS